MDEGILQPRDGLIYVERTVSGKTRKGIVLCLDLERYDYNKGSSSLIRATEGTIVDRLPPRIKIRQGAAMELPHILVLIDDPNHTVIEPLSAAKSKLEKVYDFDLMLDSGHLAGYAVNEEFENKVVDALRGLSQTRNLRRKIWHRQRRTRFAFCNGRRQSLAGNCQSHLGEDEAAGRHGSSLTVCAGGDRKCPR